MDVVSVGSAVLEGAAVAGLTFIFCWKCPDIIWLLLAVGLVWFLMPVFLAWPGPPFSHCAELRRAQCWWWHQN